MDIESVFCFFFILMGQEKNAYPDGALLMSHTGAGICDHLVDGWNLKKRFLFLYHN